MDDAVHIDTSIEVRLKWKESSNDVCMLLHRLNRLTIIKLKE